MRTAAVTLALLLAAPVLAVAQDRNRPPPTPAPSASPASPARPEPPEPALASPPSADRPPPPDAGRPPPPPPGYRPRPWGPPPPVAYPSPFWWGYGWGYGYAPLYPIHGEPSGYALAPDPASHRFGTTLRATAASGSADGSAVGVTFAVDGRHGGFDLAYDAFVPSRGGVVPGSFGRSPDSYGFGSAHVSFPILESAAYRFRLQAGGSWLSVPTSASGSSVDVFGLDLGASAHLGLVGPLGLEGHARITPFPVQVVDLRAALALRAGPFSVLGGYRVIDVAGDSRTGPAARFEGPEVGFGLIF
jgi:hypothetical protein